MSRLPSALASGEALLTSDELRSLADEATPGPWTVADAVRKGPDQSYVRFPLPGYADNFHTFVHSPENARLIALAPDLARLCAELGEAAQRAHDEPYESGTWWHALEKALAKLSEL